MKLAFALVSVACALTAVPACTVAVEPIGEPAPPAEVPARPAGTLTVRWVVNGSTDPGECAAIRAREIEVVVYDPTGAPIARATAPCDTFSVTLPLPAGTYSADVQLLTRGLAAASPSKTLDALEVVPGTDLAVTVGF